MEDRANERQETVFERDGTHYRFEIHERGLARLVKAFHLNNFMRGYRSPLETESGQGCSFDVHLVG